MNKTNTWKNKALYIALMIIMAFALSPPTEAAAAVDTLNIGVSGAEAIESQNPGRFSVSNNNITVTGPDDIIITGDGRNRSWSIRIEHAKNITIEAGTTIQSGWGNALSIC